MSHAYPEDLVRRVAASTGLPEATATRVVAGHNAEISETVGSKVRRRHAQLQQQHQNNKDNCPRKAAEQDARERKSGG